MDVWGQGYKIVMRQFKSIGPTFQLTEEKIDSIIQELFPVRADILPNWSIQEGVENFTEEEIRVACRKIRTGKAPGPDGIPPEVIRKVVEIVPQYVLEFANQLLRTQKFPADWKAAKLVLIHKAGKSFEASNAYRPLCLIDAIAKLYEHLIKNRLERELEEKGGLSPNQYGFRQGCSTIHALKRVTNFGTNTKIRGQGERWSVLITLDVKNAFNSAAWTLILRELIDKGISQYLRNIVRDYFTNRCIITGKKTLQVSSGIPQGSVLGLLLWNVFYDPVLRMDFMGGVEA